eukprot:358746-Chlamydomonas_euryale.AAC.2
MKWRPSAAAAATHLLPPPHNHTCACNMGCHALAAWRVRSMLPRLALPNEASARPPPVNQQYKHAVQACTFRGGKKVSTHLPQRKEDEHARNGGAVEHNVPQDRRPGLDALRQPNDLRGDDALHKHGRTCGRASALIGVHTRGSHTCEMVWRRVARARPWSTRTLVQAAAQSMQRPTSHPFFMPPRQTLDATRHLPGSTTPILASCQRRSGERRYQGEIWSHSAQKQGCSSAARANLATNTALTYTPPQPSARRWHLRPVPPAAAGFTSHPAATWQVPPGPQA